MSGTTRTIVVSTLVALATGAATLAAPDQSTADRPGQLTRASVYVDNREPGDAIPVVVHGIKSADAVPVRQLPQVWEYRTVTLAKGQDAARELTALGHDGWEATGLLLYDASRATVLLKRPQ